MPPYVSSNCERGRARTADLGPHAQELEDPEVAPLVREPERRLRDREGHRRPDTTQRRGDPQHSFPRGRRHSENQEGLIGEREERNFAASSVRSGGGFSVNHGASIHSCGSTPAAPGPVSADTRSARMIAFSTVTATVGPLSTRHCTLSRNPRGGLEAGQQSTKGASNVRTQIATEH